METWPAALIPNDMRWGLQHASLALQSPWTRESQIFEMQGAHWTCDVTFRNLDDGQQRELAAFLDSLRGPTNVVALPVWIHDVAQGTAGGTILATGAAHSKVVVMTGATGASPTFKRGDLIRIGGRLYRVTTDAGQAAGRAVVSIAPPLRAAAASAVVSLTELTCPMRLTGDDEAMGRFRPKPFGDFSLGFVEALP